jgi:hypothetical protein
MDKGYTLQQFVWLLSTTDADKLVSEMFEREFGSLRNMTREQCNVSRYKKYFFGHLISRSPMYSSYDWLFFERNFMLNIRMFSVL